MEEVDAGDGVEGGVGEGQALGGGGVIGWVEVSWQVRKWGRGRGKDRPWGWGGGGVGEGWGRGRGRFDQPRGGV